MANQNKAQYSVTPVKFDESPDCTYKITDLSTEDIESLRDKMFESTCYNKQNGLDTLNEMLKERAEQRKKCEITVDKNIK